MANSIMKNTTLNRGKSLNNNPSVIEEIAEDIVQSFLLEHKMDCTLKTWGNETGIKAKSVVDHKRLARRLKLRTSKPLFSQLKQVFLSKTTTMEAQQHGPFIESQDTAQFTGLMNTTVGMTSNKKEAVLNNHSHKRHSNRSMHSRDVNVDSQSNSINGHSHHRHNRTNHSHHHTHTHTRVVEFKPPNISLNEITDLGENTHFLLEIHNRMMARQKNDPIPELKPLKEKKPNISPIVSDDLQSIESPHPKSQSIPDPIIATSPNPNISESKINDSNISYSKISDSKISDTRMKPIPDPILNDPIVNDPIVNDPKPQPPPIMNVPLFNPTPSIDQDIYTEYEEEIEEEIEEEL